MDLQYGEAAILYEIYVIYIKLSCVDLDVQMIETFTCVTLTNEDCETESYGQIV